MKHHYFFVLFLLSITWLACAQKSEQKETPESPKIEQKADLHEGMDIPEDNRISLDLLPKQKRHQLQNMRSHLVAVQTIVELIAKNDFDLASKVAHSQLGSTTEMKLMCASFGNKDFEDLGLNFHASADHLSEVLKTKDPKKSLEALSVTMNYCINCHANYRQ